MKIEQKKKIVEELHVKLMQSKVVILTDYKGLDVGAINDLRRRLEEAEVEYKVVKNTLLKRASEKTDVELIRDSFVGPSAIALSYEDPVAPAKVLKKFSEENQKLEIKGGVMDGRVLDLDAIKALAVLPSREILLSQVLSAMNAVPTSLVQALSDLPRRLMNVINAIKDQKEAA